MKDLPASPLASDWATWLADAERRSLNVYQLSPERLIAEYRREREISRGYHGREILELLQNAGDAARLQGTGGKVRLMVSPLGMVMGNTGRPFDTNGVQSLQTANLSPKRQREGGVIGDKGLGFRSILNWTCAPLLSSGTLGLAFLPDHAAKQVRYLETKSDEVARRVSEEREIAGELIAPRLVFPKWISNWAAEEWKEDGLQDIATLCHSLRSEGFDTVVGMPFSSQQAFQEAVQQVDELRPEFLLLVESIAQLEIHIEGQESKLWRCHRTDNRWTICEGSLDLSSWRVTSYEGEVPCDLLDHEEKTKNRFSVTLAIAAVDQADDGFLFCYFPTEVEMPLPLLVHATLELDETRKHANDTRANCHILTVTAERIAELAEQEIACDGKDRWLGCRLVVPEGAWSSELKLLGFPDALKKSAKQRKLIPVLGGGYRTPSESKLTSGNESKWWPTRLFPEIAAVEAQKERKLAEHLGVETLTADDVLQRLLTAKNLTLKERAFSVVGLIRSKTPITGGDFSTLLCDDSGKPLPDGTQAILQPSGKLPSLPSWATIRFLHSELRLLFMDTLKPKDSRELQQLLQPFGVVEYSLSALIRPVMAEANRQVRSRPEDEAVFRRETLQFLLKIFETVGDAVPFPAEASAWLLNQVGDWVPPEKLYMGEGYGQRANITQDLYASWAEERLIAEPGQVGLESEPANLVKFLSWLGVERWPREVAAENVNGDFLISIKNGLHYPVDLGDSRFNSPNELRGAWLTNAKTVDGLPEILSHAPPEAVLAWLAFDSRSASWMGQSSEHCTLKIRPQYKQYDRSYCGDLPSYIHWQIASFPWLPTTDGSKKAPKHCLLGDRQLEILFPSPLKPDEAFMNRYGVSDEITGSFVQAGVMPGLAQLGRDQLYGLMLDVPSLSSDGKVSRTLCRWFLSNENNLFGFSGKNHERFLREGEIWGSKEGATGFYPVSELRHVDYDGLPPALLAKLSVADLPKRVGAQKVKEMLGIRPIERSEISQELVSHRRSPAHEDRAAWFERAKPFIKRLRQAQTKQAQSVGTFDRLKLVQCDELRVRMHYEEATYDHVAQEGEWFVFSESLYVLSDLDNSIDLLADAAGVAIASVFAMADGDAFAKVLRCEERSQGKLLKRMCGDSFYEEIAAAKAQPQPSYAGPIEPPAAPQLDTTGPIREEPQVESSNTGRPDTSGDGAKASGVTPLPHTPQPPPVRRPIVVRNVQRTPAKHGEGRNIVDGERCERMAEAFEAQDSSIRYALGVGHITGLDAPGFDLVSFESEGDRALFQNPSTRDWTTVQRFIEVKGRSSSTAKIELKGNELKAARKYGDRYFLYRFYEAAHGQFYVSILKNPMAAEESKETIIEVDLDRANATQRFEFVIDSDENALMAKNP